MYFKETTNFESTIQGEAARCIMHPVILTTMEVLVLMASEQF